MNTRDKIISEIRYHGATRVEDIHRSLEISKVTIHKQLRRLLGEGLIVRTGKPPLVFYTLPPETVVTQTVETQHLPPYTRQVIDANFLSITPDGKLLYGMVGFVYWTQNYQKNKALKILAEEYLQILQAQKKHYAPQGWIDATSKLYDTFKETPINYLLFKDIYSYKTFGRTKLAKLVMYAKQTGEKKLIDQISDLAKPTIEKIIKKYTIDAVSYIPPTVPRPVQFMTELASRLNLPLPEITIIKVVPGDIPIPQKTLASLEERIVNARQSMYVKNTTEPFYRNVLLIDDVVGSGASFNEVAKKLKNGNRGKRNIIAFALVGNIKGYDIIRQI